jgi:hypothetical protein
VVGMSVSCQKRKFVHRLEDDAGRLVRYVSWEFQSSEAHQP